VPQTSNGTVGPGFDARLRARRRNTLANSARWWRSKGFGEFAEEGGWNRRNGFRGEGRGRRRRLRVRAGDFRASGEQGVEGGGGFPAREWRVGSRGGYRLADPAPTREKRGGWVGRKKAFQGAGLRALRVMATGLLFSGQGAQRVGMGRSFYENSPLARSLYDEADGCWG